MPVPFEQQTTLEKAITATVDNILTDVHTINVGTIQAFYPSDSPPTVDVQIGVQKMYVQDGVTSYSPIAPLKKIPVLFYQAGGIVFTFPIKPGDTCLILFCERETNQWLLGGASGPQVPRKIRKHSYSDAFCLPMIATSATPIPNINNTAAELRTIDGMTKFSLGVTGINASVGGCTMTFNSLGLTIENGDVFVDGGITLKTHEHTSASAGNPTSPPIPPVFVEEEKNV